VVFYITQKVALKLHYQGLDFEEAPMFSIFIQIKGSILCKLSKVVENLVVPVSFLPIRLDLHQLPKLHS
jgi:hypothetical protein